jgi:sarcosine oxidase subunit beta
MKRGADLVIIGGGVNGCSLAYRLAKADYRDVVVLEKGQVASGASSRTLGGFRHQWSTEADIVLMTASIRMITGLLEELVYPGDLEVRQNGYLFLIDSEQEMERLRRNARLQRRLGIPVEILNSSESRSLVPFLDVDGLVGATFCPWDGRASPCLVTHAYAWAARRLRGADLHRDVRYRHHHQPERDHGPCDGSGSHRDLPGSLHRGRPFACYSPNGGG